MSVKNRSTSSKEAYQHARRFTKARAANFYYAFSALSNEKRNAIYAAYAFAGTVDDAVDDSANDAERNKLLTQAKNMLELAYSEQKDKIDEQEWLTRALHDAVNRFAIPKLYFQELIAGMEQDITQTRFVTYAELEQYCYRAASVIGLISIEIFGYDKRHRDLAIRSASDMGKALQITNIMRDVKEDAERGRIYFAHEDLVRYGYSETDVISNINNASFKMLMTEYGRRAEDFYTSGLRLLPLLDGPRSRMCCNGLQGVYHQILKEIVKCDYDVYTKRVSLSKIGRLKTLFRLWVTGAWPKRKLK